jgi:integrase
MSVPEASTPARDAIDAFLQHLADRGLSATTRRIRKTYLNEYLRHAQESEAAAAEANQAQQDEPGDDKPVVRRLTAGELLDPGRAAAWLAAAAAGKTRSRNTSRGPEAAAYPNSMRVRIDSVNALAEFVGLPARLDRQPPARGFHLDPGGTEALLHDLTVKRPIHSNAMTALRTAAVASLVADTGRGVPELAGLNISALRLDGAEPRVDIEGQPVPLTQATVHILTRWLAARASIVADLEGSDPGHLWIPTKPGRARGGVPSAKPGISPAAVRTLHASHRALVSQLLGTPLRPGALRAAAEAHLVAADKEQEPALSVPSVGEVDGLVGLVAVGAVHAVAFLVVLGAGAPRLLVRHVGLVGAVGPAVEDDHVALVAVAVVVDDQVALAELAHADGDGPAVVDQLHGVGAGGGQPEGHGGVAGAVLAVAVAPVRDLAVGHRAAVVGGQPVLGVDDLLFPGNAGCRDGARGRAAQQRVAHGRDRR